VSALALLSAGAAKGLVGQAAPAFTAATGVDVRGEFGAVGAMRERLAGGAACDVVILTAALIAALEADGSVVAGTAAPLGRVRTGIAVRAGAPLPAIGDAAVLAATLLAATGILFPDPQLATAGIHFVAVLRRLGIHDDVAARLRPYPNGATAMRALADAPEPGLVGCTQITEIRYTPGVALVGPLPAEFELATVYTAAVATRAADAAAARAFVAALAGPATLAQRRAGGFEA
jgi:molybdate transport system substrate-binding protein